MRIIITIDIKKINGAIIENNFNDMVMKSLRNFCENLCKHFKTYLKQSKIESLITYEIEKK